VTAEDQGVGINTLAKGRLRQHKDASRTKVFATKVFVRGRKLHKRGEGNEVKKVKNWINTDGITKKTGKTESKFQGGH